MSKIADEAFDNIKQIWVMVHYCPQIGLMVTWGKNYEGRLYFSIDLPFVWIQIFLTR